MNTLPMLTVVPLPTLTITHFIGPCATCVEYVVDSFYAAESYVRTVARAATGLCTVVSKDATGQKMWEVSFPLAWEHTSPGAKPVGDARRKQTAAEDARAQHNLDEYHRRWGGEKIFRFTFSDGRVLTALDEIPRELRKAAAKKIQQKERKSCDGRVTVSLPEGTLEVVSTPAGTPSAKP